MADEIQVPHLVARGAAEDRYLRLTRHARSWMLFACGSLLLNTVLGVAWVVRSFRADVVPFVVAVDDLGQVAAVRRATPAARPDATLIRSQLALFIRNVRTIVPDIEAQKALLLDGFAFTQKDGAAALSDYFRAHSPFDGLSDNRTVTVQIQSVLPLSGDTWQVQWSEAERRSGRALGTITYQALLTVRLSPPESAEALLVNPLGLYVVALSWTELLQGATP